MPEERDTIARAAASLDDPDAVMPEPRDHAPERIWLRYDGVIVAGDYPRPWETNPYVRADLIPAMLQEVRNEALRESVDVVNDLFRTWIDDDGSRAAADENDRLVIAGRILALIDTPALPTPAEPPGDALREALADMANCDKWPRFSFDEVQRRARTALAAAPAPQPAPPTRAKPAEDALREALSYFVAMGEQYGWDRAQTGRSILMKRARTALAAAPAPQPAPADREALVGVISKALWDAKSSSKTTVNYLTDALLARGLRLPTDAQPETLAWAVVGKDGGVMPSLCGRSKPLIEGGIRPGERVVRVSIRILEDEA